MATYAAKNFQPISKVGVLSWESFENKRASLSKELSRLDTMESLEEKVLTKSFTPEFTSPTLPSPRKSSDPDYLLLLTEAFAKSFSAMSHGIKLANQDYLNVQNLSESVSKEILANTTYAINKDNSQYALNEKINQDVEDLAHQNEVSTIVLLAVGVGLTIVSGFGGLLLDALDSVGTVAANELEMTTFSSDAAGYAEEEANDAINAALNNAKEGAKLNGPADIADDASKSDSTENEEDAAASARKSEGQIQKEQDASAQKTSRDTSESSRNDNLRSSREENKAVRDFRRENIRPERKLTKRLKIFGKTAIKMVAGGLSGLPQLITGLGEQNHIAPELEQLANLQSNLGDAYKALSLNNTFFQFYQQLAQREGSILQEQISNASEVVETYGDITQAYRQISYGLADAV